MYFVRSILLLTILKELYMEMKKIHTPLTPWGLNLLTSNLDIEKSSFIKRRILLLLFCYFYKLFDA